MEPFKLMSLILNDEIPRSLFYGLKAFFLRLNFFF